MTEQIVSFKTAKLAKEKGFDIIQRYGQIASLYKKDGKHTYYTNYGFMYSGLYEGYISAPTQSLLQKWLRENFNIIVAPETDFIGWDCRLFHPDWDDKIIVNKPRTETEPLDIFNSYEDALESGLQEALKLIR